LNPGTTFDSTKQSLQDLLKEIKSGKIQLPDFLRGWIWGPDLLKSDNFEGFFRNREAALLDRIERAMGKPIAREAVQQEKEKEVVDFVTEENEIS